MAFSFSKIALDGQLVSMWAPVTTGDYSTDCAKGRDYADEVVAAMRQNGIPALLGWVVRGFGQDDARVGVEAGFCQRIAEHTLCG